jgi:hypothetical protein
MEVPLDDGRVPVELPGCDVSVAEPAGSEAVDARRAARRAVADPHGPPLAERVGADDAVAVVVTDVTRATPDDVLLDVLLSELDGAGVGAPKDANLYQATRAATYVILGAHNPLRSGGRVVVPATLPEGAGEGTGERRFHEWLFAADSAREVYEAMCEGYEPGAQRAFVVARALLDHEVWVTNSRHPKVVEECLIVTTLENFALSPLPVIFRPEDTYRPAASFGTMSSTIGRESVPLGAGAAAGAVAWLLGYVFTYIVAGTRIRDSGLSQFLEFLGEGGAVYKLVGWVLFNSHFVETVVEGAPVSVAANAIGGENGFTPLLFVVPPALLLAAGLVLARYRGAEAPDAGALAGLATVPAYLVLSVLGVFLFTISAGPATGRPDLLLAVVLAGVVYPAVFGAAGGALGGATAE